MPCLRKLLMTCLGLLVQSGCVVAAPPPLDSLTIPTTRTSAEPLFITNTPFQEAADAAVRVDAARAPLLPAALPSLRSFRMDSMATCPTKHCQRSHLLPKPHELSSRLADTAPMLVWQEHLGAGTRLDFPRVRGVNLLGVVLHGVVTAAPSEGGALAAMQGWGIFSAPGAGLAITAHHDSSADVLLFAYGDHAELKVRLAALRQDERTVYWPKRPGSFEVEDLQRIPEVAWNSGEAHVRMGLDTKRSPGAYLGALVAEKLASMAAHAHQSSWEVLTFLQVKGEVTWDENKPPSRVHSGSVVMVPPGTMHGWKPDGTEPLLAVQVFLPPGPEARFQGDSDTDEARKVPQKPDASGKIPSVPRN